MKHGLQMAALGALLSLMGGAVHAQANNVYFQVINDSLSGGDPVFSVTDDVTFTNLTLTERFFDGTTSQVNLYDLGSGVNPPAVPQTTLDTGVIELDSRMFPDPFKTPSLTHGYVTSATLTGSFDNGLLPDPATGFLSLGIDKVPFDFTGASAQTVNVLPNFTSILLNPTAGSTFLVYAANVATGELYGAGTFSLVAAPAAAPEPSETVLLAFGSLGLVGLSLVARRRTHSAVSANDEGITICA